MHARMLSVVVFLAERLQAAATAAGGFDGCRRIQPNSAQPSSDTYMYRKHARFHLCVSACEVIVFGDNLGKRLGYGLRDISGD